MVTVEFMGKYVSSSRPVVKRHSGLIRREERFEKLVDGEAAEHEVRSGVCRTNHDGAATA
jgi:hypothetical protein